MKEKNSLDIHKILNGKLEIKSKIPVNSKLILSKIYTPGVAEAVKSIKRKKNKVYDLTIKSNTVAVVTDGSAVLGLGNVGAEAALPVMEGKCVIFKEFAGLDAFPICLATQKSEEIINSIKNISPVFAAINLEDIAAPKCFEIEKKLQNLGIPVVHDDQHATAIIVLAGLINDCKVIKANLKKSKITVCGTGAAGTAIIKLLFNYGCRNIIAVDKEGIIEKSRKSLPNYKKDILKITNKENITGSLNKAIQNRDIFLGVSAKNLVSEKMVKSMNMRPVIFALANPDPEISRIKALKAGALIYASGRSDDVNQINNALVFPGFFRGLIKWKITKITNDMKIKTARAIARLIKNPTPNHFIPDIFDKRLVNTISKSTFN